LAIAAFPAIPASLRAKGEKAIMIMKTGEQWRCTNPVCHCEVLVQSDSALQGENPRCVCGSPLKKKYAPPHLTYLEFLRIEDPLLVGGISNKA